MRIVLLILGILFFSFGTLQGMKQGNAAQYILCFCVAAGLIMALIGG